MSGKKSTAPRRSRKRSFVDLLVVFMDCATGTANGWLSVAVGDRGAALQKAGVSGGYPVDF